MMYMFEFDDISGLYLVDHFSEDSIFQDYFPDTIVDCFSTGFGVDSQVAFFLDESAIKSLYDRGFSIDGCQHPGFSSVDAFLHTIGIERS